MGNKSKNNKKPKLRLISKRGTTLKGSFACSSCKRQVYNPTRYAESTRGPVILCAECKSRIRSRSFRAKRPDALDIAFRGGGFEGARKKH